jgi:hypothetical protein
VKYYAVHKVNKMTITKELRMKSRPAAFLPPLSSRKLFLVLPVFSSGGC